jgi:peptide/nickel transport system ATP-binding protein
MTAPVLQVHALGVTATESARLVLDDLTFDVAAGSSLGVVGASGAGKSTLGLALMRLLPAALRITPGSSVRLGNVDLATLDAAAMRAVRGRRIAMVFQEPITALDPAMTIGDQLAEAVLAHGLSPVREARERALAMLDRVGIGGGSAGARRYPHELSGGMRQRLLLAMPLMLDPQVLIADEPTTALDPVRQAQMLDLLDDLRAESGTALLLISHDLGIVGERCERVIVLEEGRVVKEGMTADVLAPRRPFFETDPRRGKSSSPSATAAPLLEVRDLVVTYPERRRGFRAAAAVPAVESVTLAIEAGEVLGVIGESGCGKTSLALAILRLIPSHAAALRFAGEDLARLAPEPLRRMRRHLQYMPQDAGASLSPHLDCESLVSEGLIVHGLCDARKARRRACALLEELGLPPQAARARPHELATGQRQRVALARALATGPRLLICDEPVSSVDPPTRARLLDLLAALRASRGLAMLFVSHDVAAVARIADRVAVMQQGRLVEMGPTASVLLAPAHACTRTMLAAVPTGAPLPRRVREARLTP